MIFVVVKFVFKEESLEQISKWLIENPDKGAIYLALLYLIGVPLTLPSMPLLFIGSYAAAHIFGFISKLKNLILEGGMAYMFVFNLIFLHLAMILAFLVGRYLFRNFIL